jgi:peroxiredoxin
LQAYQDIAPEIKGLGAALLAISPQTPEYSLSRAQKHQLGFEVLSDAGNRVARQYGLVYSMSEPLRELYKDKFGVDLPDFNGEESYELPVPGTFLVDTGGLIRFVFVDPDYTNRLEPAEIIEKLQEITGTVNGPQST